MRASRITNTNWRMVMSAGLMLALASALLPGAEAAEPLPDFYVLSGVTRDFQSSHDDFQVMPSLGFGHYSGLVDKTLDADGKPLFVGNGFKVLAPATDTSGQAIAPHLANMSCGGGATDYPPMLADGRIRGRNTSIFDGYDSSLGPYGGANVTSGVVATNSVDPAMIVVDNSSTLYGDAFIGPGGVPAVVVDVQGTMTGTIENLPQVYVIPPISAPLGLPIYPGGDFTVPMNGSATVSSNWHIQGEWDIRRGAVVTINGDVTIVCDDRWLIGKDATVLIPDGSSLTIYCLSQVRLYGPNTIVNPDTANPSKLEVFMLGNDIWNHQMVLNGSGTMICAHTYAQENIIDLDQSAQLYGTFVGMAVEINNQSQVHMDMRDYGAGGGMESDPGLGDNAAVLDTTPSNGGVTSPATFADWFTDVPGANLSTITPITLVKQADDTYLFDDTLDPQFALLGGFFPIDDRLFGNEGGSHNHHFTHRIEAEFTYDAAAGQFIEYTGDADLWVFINDELVIDLGGVHPLMNQRIDLDRLCLDDGETYPFTIHMAHRYAPVSSFRIATNLVLTNTTLPTMTAAFD